MKTKQSDEVIKLIPLEQIHDSPWQGRLLETGGDMIDYFDNNNLEELAKSISQSGLLQPVILRKAAKGYEIIDGHRRLLAYKMLKRPAIEAIVREFTDREAQISSIVGNLQRKNLKNIEMALAFRKVLDAGIFNDTRELSKAIGKNETVVADTINLLKLDKRIIDDLAKNNTIKDVRLLRSIRHYDEVDEDGDSDLQWELYQRVIKENLTREALIDIVKGVNESKKREPYTVSSHRGSLQVVINTRKFNAEKRKLLEKMMNEKIVEIMKMFAE